LPDADPSKIGAENYKTLQNLRPTATGLEGVQGYTFVNTAAISGAANFNNKTIYCSPHKILTDYVLI